MAKKTWREKLHTGKEPEVVDTPASMGRLGQGKMLIPTPLMVDELIREVPLGAVTTPRLLRWELARRAGVEVACPLCTGIFVRISAEAANEARAEGAPVVTPYWRVVGEKGKLNPKFPGGTTVQETLLGTEMKALTDSF